MTTSKLLAWILGAITLQILAGLAWAAWRGRHAPPSPMPVPADTPPAPSAAKGAWPGWRLLRVRARRMEDAAHTQCSFELEDPQGRALPPFAPGQFLTFRLPVVSETGEVRPQIRCYSLSNAADAGYYRVTIKRVPAAEPGLPPGRGSGHWHERVQAGDLLEVQAPAGHFVLDRASADVPVVLIAGGIGITPMMSMLDWCLRHQPQRPVHLFYGLRHGAEHAFKAELEALAAAHAQLRLHVVYSRPAPQDRPGQDFHHTGHITLDLLRAQLPHGRHQFYLCGPAALMQSLVPALQAWGVPAEDVHHEAFGPASVATAAPAARPDPGGASVSVRFTRSGRTLDWRGSEGSLLAFAEAHGIALDSGCRAGGCGACQTRLLSGQVEYAQPPDHTPAPGHCLPCVASPVPGGPVVLEA